MSTQVTYKTPIPANGTVKNALADTDLAIAPGWGFLTIYGRQEAASGGVLDIDFKQGNEQQMVDGGMTANNALNPNRQDDIILGPIPVMPGKSLRSEISETAGFQTALNVVFDFVSAAAEVVLSAFGPRPGV